MILAMYGVASGLVIALPMGFAARSMLYGVAPADPVALGGAILILFTVVFVASYGPARRSAQLNPVELLRVE